jgi:cell division protein FtsW
MIGSPATSQAKRRVTDSGSYDQGIVLSAVALAAFGIIMVASSSISIADNQQIGPFYYLIRHLVFLAGGVVLAVVLARTELEFFERNAGLLLVVGIGLLLLVFVPGIGMRINGARRWIHLGISSFQTVEVVKLILIVYLASYLVRHRDAVQASMLGVLKPIAVAGMLVGLLLAQPDFGSATLLVAVSLGMIWLGGARLRNLGLLAAMTTPALAWAALFEEYRLKRLKSFLDPWADPYNEGFQLTQALIAVGRGEWFGVGLGASVQKLFYLPMAHTDFILAVIAEELGFFGIVLVLGLFAWLVTSGLRIGLRAIERGQRFGGYCAFGVSLLVAFQSLVSIGVNLGALPTKGLTLPLISSGGSSVLMTCAAIGLLARVSYELSRAERSAEQAVANDAEAPA